MMTTQKKELIIWHEFDGPGDTSIQVLEQLCEEYSKEYGIQVTAEVMNLKELIDRLNNIANGGKTAHMAFVPADIAVFWESALYSEVPKSLSSIVEAFETNDLSSMQVGAIQYGLPILKGNHMVLYYNREIFNKSPESWEEIESLSSQLKQQGIVSIGADLQDPYWFIPFFTAFGGWPVHEGRPTFLNHEMQQALHFVSDQMEAGILTSLNGSNELLEDFIAGKVGAIICGEWIYNYLDQQMGARLGIGKLPAINGVPSVSMSSLIGLVYPNRSLDVESEWREEIISFSKFMLSEECQLKWGTKVQRIPVHPEVQKQLVSTYSPNRAQLTEQLRNSRPIPIEAVMSSIWSAMGPGLRQLQHGAVRAFNTMEQTFQEMNSKDGREKVES